MCAVYHLDRRPYLLHASISLRLNPFAFVRTPKAISLPFSREFRSISGQQKSSLRII
jgi:hypothetical protein